MRILLFTGKGGVGKTTVAAATATRAAEHGLRTIVCSTDPAHSLADAFDAPLGDRPTAIADRLFGQQLNARVRFEEAWDDVRAYLVDVLDWAGAGAVEAEELAVIPGLRSEHGLRTIVCSTDPAHSLADAFDAPLGDRPTAIADRLFGQQLNARVRFEEAWDDVRAYLVDVLDWAGAGAVEAEELAVIPGL